MKKVILTMMITLGLALTASADKKGHNKYNDNHNNHGQYDNRGHNNGYRNHDNGYRGHNNSYSSTVYITKKVWVPGCSERVWIAPRYEYVRQHCGRVVRVCVSQGYYKVIQKPGYYTYQQVPVYRNSNQCDSRNGLSISWRW